jgi:hypothetical protein
MLITVRAEVGQEFADLTQLVRARPLAAADGHARRHPRNRSEQIGEAGDR